jgi:antirestriction protein ArdC
METLHKPKVDTYELITQRVIDHIEKKGVAPWRQPWTKAGLPQNLITKKSYTGINVWILASLGYDRNYFLTYNQVKSYGGAVRAKEHSCPVVFWKTKEIEDPITKEMKKVSLLRYYSVFNIDQCVGIPEEKIPAFIPRENKPIETCEAIVKGMPECPKIQHVELEAYYTPVFDYINMPNIKSFINSPSYYATLFHELTHSTGARHRLNRKELVESATFGSEKYSMEELTAELGSCYLQFFAGIVTDNYANNASYIYNWLSKLKSDKRLIVLSAAKAQRAVDYILNTTKPTNE